MAIALATKFSRSREMPRDELVSEANLALITAINKYDPAVKPGRFRSYAASVIIHVPESYTKVAQTGLLSRKSDLRGASTIKNHPWCKILLLGVAQ